MRKAKMGALLVALSGAMLFSGGGCLGGWWQAALRGLPGTLVAEFLLDNGNVFDLFPSGNSVPPIATVP